MSGQFDGQMDGQMELPLEWPDPFPDFPLRYVTPLGWVRPKDKARP